jgi:multiple sugar transport system substrate-binding protein
MIVSAGCSFGSNNPEGMEKFDDKKNYTIKVMYFDEQYFMQQYGNMFMSKYPNINIEVVSTSSLFKDGLDDPVTKFKKFIEEHQPDVIRLSSYEIEGLANEQLLYELDPIIAQDKFDIENIHPTIIDYLKLKGKGKLYGLAPSFHSEALYINRDLFNKHGVELPAEPMSWETMLNLAQRFPTDGDKESKIYGYTSREWQADAYSMIMEAGLSSGLAMQTEGKASLNSPAWKNIFEMITNAVKSGAVHTSPPPEIGGSRTQEEALMSDKFVAGKAAMILGDYNLIYKLNEAGKYMKDLKFNWEIIHAPKDADATQRTNFTLFDMYAINAKSSNKRAAWEFIKYVNSDLMAKVFSKSQSDLLSRPAYKNVEGRISLEPFYQLSFNKNETNEFGEYEGAQYTIKADANKLIDEFLANKKTLDQVLEGINTKLQEELDKIKLKKDNTEKK